MNSLAAAYRWLDDDGPAFGAPGLEPRWTSSRKDAVSTAYAASSRIWFTISHGTLNEIYYPTIDRPQTRDMELLFTDGETFFHEEKRDLEYDFHYIDPKALALRVVANDLQGRYTVTKEFITDPHHPVVLMNVKITGDEAVLSRLKCYALLAPHLDGGGAGNSARSIEIAGQRAILAWKNNTSLAMGADCGFTRTSCGYVGASDGYQDLSTNMKMDWQFGQALDGNIAVMGEIDVAAHREFTIAIALGDGHHAALAGMMQTLSTPFELHRNRFVIQWLRANSPESLAHAATDGGRLMRISHNVILTHEDKTYSGAFIASASIPWGASKGDDDLGGYHLVWTRDMVQSATAMLACGRTDTALRALVYLACTQRPDGSFAQNFWIDGTPYWTGIQLDEVAFPIILAWRLWKLDGLGNFDVFPFVERAAAFLVRYAPVTQQERWEENAGYSPSTLAAVISGLICAADIARAHESPELAAFLESYADWIESHLDEWTTTNRRRPPPRRQTPLHAHPPARRRRALPQRRHPSRLHPHRQPQPRREVRLRGPRSHRRRLPRARPLRHPPRRRPPHHRLPQSRRPLSSRSTPPTAPAGAATTTTATASAKTAAPTKAGDKAAPGPSSPASAPTTSSPPAATSAPTSPPSSASAPSAACSPSRSGTTPTSPPKACTSAAPPAPPSPSSGPTPSTSSSSAPSPTAASSTASPSSKTATPSPPPSAPSPARSKSSRPAGPSPASPPASPSASSTQSLPRRLDHRQLGHHQP